MHAGPKHPAGSSQDHARTTVCLVTSSWHAKSSGFNFPPWSLKCQQSLPVSLVWAAHVRCLSATLAEQRERVGSVPSSVVQGATRGRLALPPAMGPSL